ncbi:hypothetical protein YC2023_060682 [Brassica napus]
MEEVHKSKCHHHTSVRSRAPFFLHLDSWTYVQKSCYAVLWDNQDSRDYELNQRVLESSNLHIENKDSKIRSLRSRFRLFEDHHSPTPQVTTWEAHST